MFKISLLSLLLIHFGAAPKPQESKTYLLQYKPELGTKGVMNMEMDINMNMEMMGKQLPMTQNMTMDCNLKVVDQDEKTTTTSIDYNYVTYSMKNAYVGTMEYDSRKVDSSNTFSSTMNTSMRPILDSTMMVVQNRAGKVMSNAGEQGLVSAASSGAGTTNITSLMGMSQFPEKKVKIGDNWTNSTADPNSPMAMKMTYTLAKVEKGVATVKMQGIIAMNSEFAGEAGFKTIAGTQSGYFTYDIKNMWLLDGEIVHKYKMTMVQQGAEIPADVVSIITMDVK